MSGSICSARCCTDPRFGWAVVRSLAFATGSTIGCFVVGFALAYLVCARPFRGQAFYYTIFILPMLTVPVFVAYTAEMLYQSGPINDLISRISGIDFKPMWLTDPNIALPTMFAIWNWALTSPFIILLRGLLPFRVKSSRQILGASRWRIFWEVELPLLRPGDPRPGAALLKPWPSSSRPGPCCRADRGPRRDTSGLHLPHHVAVFRDLQGRCDVLSRHAADDRHRSVRDPAAAAGETVARRHVRRAEGWLDAEVRRRRITAVMR